MTKKEKIQNWIGMYGKKGLDIDLTNKSIEQLGDIAEFVSELYHSPVSDIFEHSYEWIKNTIKRLNQKFDSIFPEDFIKLYNYIDTHPRTRPEKWNGDERWKLFFCKDVDKIEKINYEKTKELFKIEKDVEKLKLIIDTFYK